MTRHDRLIDAIERVAAAFLAVVTLITFVSVFLRYGFSWSIPDGFDIGRNLLGIIIFWGIALAGYRGEHITVDLVWSVLPRPLQRAMDIFAGLVTLGGMAVFAWMLADKVLTTRADNVSTFDLRIPVWGFFLVAWLGIALSVILLVVRTWRLIAGRAESQASATLE